MVDTRSLEDQITSLRAGATLTQRQIDDLLAASRSHVAYPGTGYSPTALNEPSVATPSGIPTDPATVQSTPSYDDATARADSLDVGDRRPVTESGRPATDRELRPTDVLRDRDPRPTDVPRDRDPNRGR